MDLRLDHPHAAAELLRRVERFFDAERGEPARRRHAILPEDFLALVFVDLHAALPLYHFGYQMRTVSVLVSSAWHWSSWNGFEPSSCSSFISPANDWIAAVGLRASISVRGVQPRTPPSSSFACCLNPRTRFRPTRLRYAGAIVSQP